jgi:hypothetical protein
MDEQRVPVGLDAQPVIGVDLLVQDPAAAAAAIYPAQQRAAGRVEAPTLLPSGEEQRSRPTRLLT